MPESIKARLGSSVPMLGSLTFESWSIEAEPKTPMLGPSSYAPAPRSIDAKPQARVLVSQALVHQGQAHAQDPNRP